jgi:hypothetical protein
MYSFGDIVKIKEGFYKDEIAFIVGQNTVQGKMGLIPVWQVRIFKKVKRENTDISPTFEIVIDLKVQENQIIQVAK